MSKKGLLKKEIQIQPSVPVSHLGSPAETIISQGIGLAAYDFSCVHLFAYAHNNLTTIFDIGPILMVAKPLPKVLIVHTGGTLGMDPQVGTLDRSSKAKITCGHNNVGDGPV